MGRFAQTWHIGRKFAIDGRKADLRDEIVEGLVDIVADDAEKKVVARVDAALRPYMQRMLLAGFMMGVAVTVGVEVVSTTLLALAGLG